MGQKSASPKSILSLAIIILFMVSPVLAGVSPLSDIATERVIGYCSSPPYGWQYSYDIGLSNYEVNIKLLIALTGDFAVPSLVSTWENGIEAMWNCAYDIVDDDFRYHVNFDAEFTYDPYAPAHQVVTVLQGQGRGNMVYWFTTSDWGEAYNGAFAAHEVGHMFSLFDEYDGGALDPTDPIVDTSSIMGSLDGVAYERHYLPFLNWLQTAADDETLYLGEYDPDWKIPEPCTLLLFGFGLLIVKRKRVFGKD